MKTPLTTIFTCDNSGVEIGKFESALLDYKVTSPRTLVEISGKPINEKLGTTNLWEIVDVDVDFIDLVSNTIERNIKVSRVIL